MYDVVYPVLGGPSLALVGAVGVGTLCEEPDTDDTKILMSRLIAFISMQRAYASFGLQALVKCIEVERRMPRKAALPSPACP
eukprot:350561-Chlamydomonas_euryale.AAC.15